MALHLPRLEPVERLSPQVIRILGGNPGSFTLQGTNTYLLGTGPERILIDTGAGLSAWSSELRSVLTDEACTVTCALLTHYHADHVGGVDDLLAGCPDASVHKYRPAHPSASAATDARLAPVLRPLAPGQTFRVPGAAVRALFTPGHTPDHVAFALEPPDASTDGGAGANAHTEGPCAMFTGDAVLGHGTAVFDDLTAYEKCLATLAAECDAAGGPPVRGYPGHGAVLEDLGATVARYQSHRAAREKEILRALRDGARTTPAIVDAVYGGLDADLQKAAGRSVELALGKMESDGQVRREGEKWEACEDRAEL